MAAGYFNFTIEQGATFRQDVIWKDSEEQPVTLIGYTARMQVRRAPSYDPFIDLTTENGGITLGTTDGKITLFLSAEDTATIISPKGDYDLELVSGDGTVTRLLEGSVRVSPNITQ